MSALLSNFRNTMIVSFLLALVMIYAFVNGSGSEFGDVRTWQAILRWAHLFFGILWIGLLYYFNFVQIRVMPAIPAELKPAISKHIAPEALFWFRWSALATVLAGVVLAHLNGYLVQVLTLGALDGFVNQRDTLMGIGVWLALIMFLNVWGVIWPNQKIALGIKEADADAKAKAAKTAMQFSRINTLLSLPMLVAMGMTQTLFGS
jgi:uncharacterized membrane protein